ncbi:MULTISPECIES: baseplate J/gp47 family protein [Methanobacterium]|uniref:Baseplate protein J-like barrel domain-containing protein n=1 Tax=Methanobacterium bryantii TaxID=2161 RepID=A0A2A2H8Q5_METBR|nr:MULTISPECIES: baseplate J/gp47 family protein [Methanobacterium]OEC87900.1 hypothetical protein A9507_06910 [Methanobacterium sp. A39]PAV05767.1 hypothetical protein ASJ80_08520 [Methanobacterium bryantii]
MYEDLYFTKPTGEIVNLSDIVNDLLEIQQQAQLEGLNKVTDYTPGSQAYHALYQQALIIFQQLERINESEINTLPFSMTGDYLDYWGNSIGVPRNGEVSSSGVIVIALTSPATEDITFTEGSIASTQDSVTFVLDEDATIVKDSSTVQVKVVCTISGTVGNVLAGAIDTMITDYPYDLTITNPNAFTNGEDEEDNESYHERLLGAPDNFPPGSKGWYEATANSVDNIHDSYFINRPADQTATVGLVFNCKDKSIVSTTLAALTSLFNTDKYNVGGIDLILTPATEVSVFTSNTIQVQIGSNYTWSAIKNKIITVVESYFTSRNLGQSWSTDDIKFLIASIEGVTNVVISPSATADCSVYEVFTTDTSTLDTRITEVT